MKNKIEIYKKDKTLDLEKIINDYNSYVHTIINNLAKNNLSYEDIEEIVSDTFFILWKNTNKLENDKVLSSYIAGIVRNLIKEKYRKINLNLDIEDFENSIYKDISIDMICEQRENINEIEKIISKFKKDDILIFNMFYNSNLKISEIATTLDINSFNVKMRLHRMRTKIKKELSKRGYSNE